MMTLTVLNGIGRDNWNSMVNNLGGNSFHTYEWSIFNTEHRDAAKSLYLIWEKDNYGVVGILTGCLVSKHIPGSAGLKRIFFSSFPACKRPELFETMLEELILYAKENSIMTIDMNSFGSPFGTEILQKFGFSTSKRWEFLIDLNCDQEELFKKFNENKRRKIRKAEKMGLSVKCQNDMDAIMQLRELAIKTQKRKQSRDISFPVPDKTHYEKLKTDLIDKKVGKLYLAYDGVDCVASAFFGISNRTVYYNMGAASEIGLKKCAPDLIIWTCMKENQAIGNRWFNLGGVSKQDLNGGPLEKSGLYYFKKSFGAIVYPCFTGTLVLRPLKYALYSALKRMRSII